MLLWMVAMLRIDALYLKLRATRSSRTGDIAYISQERTESIRKDINIYYWQIKRSEIKAPRLL